MFILGSSIIPCWIYLWSREHSCKFPASVAKLGWWLLWSCWRLAPWPILFFAARPKRCVNVFFMAYKFAWVINISKALFPVHFPFKLEETVVRDFKLLSSAFVSDLLDTFLKSSNAKQNFQHGPIKIAELGVEVNHLGSLAVIWGLKFEGFLLQIKLSNTALAQ